MAPSEKLEGIPFQNPAPFFMPHERQPHVRTWLAWPCNKDLWPRGLEVAEIAYLQVARAISAFEPVSFLINEDQMPYAALACQGYDITLHQAVLDDSWLRDSGASIVINAYGKRAAVCWQFDAYGKKFPYENDKHNSALMAKLIDIPRFEAPLVLEGGAFHVDGQGNLLTTRQFMAARHPRLSDKEFSEIARDYLGVKKVLFLPHGLPGDWDTDGHVDNVAAFGNKPSQIVILTAKKGEPNYVELKENARYLQSEKLLGNRRIQTIGLQQPPPRENERGVMPLSYLNYYLVNGGVICPAYDTPALHYHAAETDETAQKVLKATFPDRQVVAVPSLALNEGGGCIHCITQQEPVPLRRSQFKSGRKSALKQAAK